VLKIDPQSFLGSSEYQEIAQALFVTTKTVEVHLESACHKHGITSVSELSDALGVPG
jgi:DNA-binding CsgD family transcriptional regulator